MLIYLLRHAEAENLITSDEARDLTTKGEKQARGVGSFCKEQNLIPGRILASPLVRARRTAEIVAERIGVEVEIQPFLACGMRPGTATSVLGEYAQFESVMLVGHEPDFSELVGHLIGLRHSGGIQIRKASLTAIDWDGSARGGGVLQFTLPPRLV